MLSVVLHRHMHVSAYASTVQLWTAEDSPIPRQQQAWTSTTYACKQGFIRLGASYNFWKNLKSYMSKWTFDANTSKLHKFMMWKLFLCSGRRCHTNCLHSNPVNCWTMHVGAHWSKCSPITCKLSSKWPLSLHYWSDSRYTTMLTIKYLCCFVPHSLTKIWPSKVSPRNSQACWTPPL